MGFSSQNDYLTKVYNNAQLGYTSWIKFTGTTAPLTIGRWYNMGYLTGNPIQSRFGERMVNGFLYSATSITACLGWTSLPTGWTFTFGQAPTLVKTAGSANAAVATGTQNIVVGGVYGVEIWVSVNAVSTLVVTLGGSTVGTISAAAGQYHFISAAAVNTTDLTITATTTTTATINGCSIVLLGSGVPCFDADQGGLYMGGAVSTKTKHFLSSSIMTQPAAAAFNPGVWKLVDVLMSYPVNMNSSAVQILSPIGGNYSVAFGAVSGTPWTYGTGWSYTSGTTVAASSPSGTLSLPVANFSTGNTGGPIQNATNAGTGGVYTYVYNLTFTIASLTGSGTIKVSLGGVDSSIITLANGTYTQFITPVNSSGGIIFTTTGTNTFNLSNVSCTAALPRYSNGVGVQAMVCWHSGAWQLASNATSTAVHNITIGYTNSSNTSGKFTPISVAGLAGAVPTMGHIDNSGIAVNNYGPFLPLSVGDNGIQSVQTFQTAATGANNYAEVILCKELFTLPHATPISTASATERDFLNQVRTLPQIRDGANLQWLFMTGAATAGGIAASGSLKYVWG